MKPTEEDYHELLRAAFGKGEPSTQLIAALMVRCSSLEGTANEGVPKLKAAINDLMWRECDKGNTRFFRDLADALEELNRSPAGRNPMRVAMLADKIKGGPRRATAECSQAFEAAG